jgi:hypothetical protein
MISTETIAIYSFENCRNLQFELWTVNITTAENEADKIGNVNDNDKTDRIAKQSIEIV